MPSRMLMAKSSAAGGRLRRSRSSMLPITHRAPPRSGPGGTRSGSEKPSECTMMALSAGSGRRPTTPQLAPFRRGRGLGPKGSLASIHTTTYLLIPRFWENGMVSGTDRLCSKQSRRTACCRRSWDRAAGEGCRSRTSPWPNFRPILVESRILDWAACLARSLAVALRHSSLCLLKS